jgi:hypothetical protein
MSALKWLFDGLGTAAVSALVGVLIGGGVGYRIGIKESIRQRQKAGNNSNQIQIGQIDGRQK